MTEKKLNVMKLIDYFPRIAKSVRKVVFVMLIFLLAACQSGGSGNSNSAGEEQGAPALSGSASEVAEGSEQINAGQQDQPQAGTMDPVVIQENWENYAHADTFVVDADGNNNSCARCHAPANWFPSIDEMPESCFACKFEVSDPPPYVEESVWENISCNVCHLVDKKNNIEPGYTYLEVAAIEEYSAVATTTELCQKCHIDIDLPGHKVADLGGAHADYTCTACHDAHDTKVSCSSDGCHNDVIDPAVPIPGHDADHEIVLCVACHDASGMDVGFSEELGGWTTLISDSSEAEESFKALTSHNLVKEADCERCHFEGNPWNLSTTVSVP